MKKSVDGQKYRHHFCFYLLLSTLITIAVLSAAGLVLAKAGMLDFLRPSVSGQSDGQSSFGSVSLPEVDNPVKESAEAEDESYFDDAVFLGDSLTYGISSYDILKNAIVLAEPGITLEGAMTTRLATFPGGERATLVDAVSHYEPGKIYVMLGTNGFAFTSLDDFIKQYGEMLDTLIEQNPNAIIYVQSILPVCSFLTEQDSRYSNRTIDRFNDALLTLANEKGVHYLNVAERFKTSDGSMNPRYSSDGMHISQGAYDYWIEYLLSHTAK